MNLAISLAHDSAAEQATRTQLERLLDGYDLHPWLFTDRVVIDETTIPHSHPVLTLHTRHLDDDMLLLATYIHEQLHWFLLRDIPAGEAAIDELRARYPNPPIGFPKGANDEESSYEHYLVCYLEYAGMRSLVGEAEARRVMDFWQRDHYTEIYSTVMRDLDAIAEITRRHLPEAPGTATQPRDSGEG